MGRNMSIPISMPASCLICYNAYDRIAYQPCTLVCGHSLCLKCGTTLTRCPICKAANTNRKNIKPNYEMMDLIDENKKYKLECIEEKIKRLAPEYCTSVKREEVRLAELSQELKEIYRITQEEMEFQKKIVEESFQFYMNDWEKKYALLLQSLDFENKRIEELDKEMKEFSSFKRILKTMNNDQNPDEFQRNLDICKRDFESFKSSSLPKNLDYEYVPMKPPIFQDIIYEIQISIPSEVYYDKLINGSDGIPDSFLQQGSTLASHPRRRTTNPFDD